MSEGALPSGYAVRHPVPDDAEAVFDLVTASDIHEFGEPQGATVADIRHEWRIVDPARDAWLVVAPDGELAGYVSLQDRGHVRLYADGYVHPDHLRRGVGTALVRLTEKRGREMAALAPASARVVIINGINANTPDACALLDREGYVPDRYYLRMEAELDAAPPAPEWPSGIAVRHMEPDEDGWLFHQVKQEAMVDHHGYVPQPFEEWANAVMGERLDRDLFFIAMAGDEPAGVAMCHDADGTGWVELLAVRRPWRHQGLGMALLREAAGAFYRRGLPRYALAVDSASPTGATRLYERAGMRPTQTYAGYLKELRPAADLANPAEE
jgi:GNAT superfamily N-acetyltransferase